jgi:PPOX class probable F420-dependent enzyme
MPKPPLPPKLDAFLSQPNPSVIGTLDPDGSPHTAATWYLWEGGRVLVNMDEGRKRLEYMRRDPRVSITVLAKDDWYHHVTLRGRIVSIEGGRLDDIDRIARHYTGQPYPDRSRDRFSAWIEVDSWYSWAVSEPWTGSDCAGRCGVRGVRWPAQAADAFPRRRSSPSAPRERRRGGDDRP